MVGQSCFAVAFELNISRKEKFGKKKRKAGFAEEMDATCPEIVMKYNRLTGGVDLMDQMKTAYQSEKRFRNFFYIRLFFDLMDIAMNNACVVW